MSMLSPASLRRVYLDGLLFLYLLSTDCAMDDEELEVVAVFVVEAPISPLDCFLACGI